MNSSLDECIWEVSWRGHSSSATAQGPSVLHVCLILHHSPPSSCHSSHLISHRAEYDLDQCNNMITTTDTRSEETAGKLSWKLCSSSGTGCQYHSCCFATPPVAWFHSLKPSSMLTPWSPMGCFFVVFCLFWFVFHKVSLHPKLLCFSCKICAWQQNFATGTGLSHLEGPLLGVTLCYLMALLLFSN